jgi:hypothetical protein
MRVDDITFSAADCDGLAVMIRTRPSGHARPREWSASAKSAAPNATIVLAAAWDSCERFSGHFRFTAQSRHRPSLGLDTL